MAVISGRVLRKVIPILSVLAVPMVSRAIDPVASTETTGYANAYDSALGMGLCADHDSLRSAAGTISQGDSGDLYARLLSLAMCNRGAELTSLIRDTPPGMWSSAVNEWERVTREGLLKNPSDCVALLFRADAQRRVGNDTAAEGLVEQLKRNGGCPGELIASASLLEGHSLLVRNPADKGGEARRLLKEARAAAPGSSAPLVDLGFYYLTAEHFAPLQAKAYFAEALDDGCDPQNPMAKIGLAKATGDTDIVNKEEKEAGLRILVIWLLKRGGVYGATKESIVERAGFTTHLSVLAPGGEE